LLNLEDVATVLGWVHEPDVRTDGGTSESYRADVVTGEPVTVEWQGGTARPPWSVTVDPYRGWVVVNGRGFDVTTLVSEDVPEGMYWNVGTEGDRELCTDGGVDPHQELAQEWIEKADKNVDKWGDQDVETLLLVAQEELGELTRAILEYQHEEGTYDRIFDELDDLGPVLFQLYHAVVMGDLHHPSEVLRTDGGVNSGPAGRPEWADVLAEQLGEDPLRFLLYKPYGPIDVPELVERRIAGIDEIRIARGWIAAERRLGLNREGVLRRLEARIDELEEIGERPDRLVYLEPVERDDVQDGQDDEPEVLAHVDCGAVVERRSWMAFFCPECEELVSRHRVEAVDPDDVQERELVTDGGVLDGDRAVRNEFERRRVTGHDLIDSDVDVFVVAAARKRFREPLMLEAELGLQPRVPADSYLLDAIATLLLYAHLLLDEEISMEQLAVDVAERASKIATNDDIREGMLTRCRQYQEAER